MITSVPRSIHAGTSRRTFLLGSAAAAAALLGGCSTSSSPAVDHGSANSAGFPKLLQGAFGQTQIPDKPSRVVALGFGRDADTAAALGLPPIAMQSTPTEKDHLEPWISPALHEPRPELINVAAELPIEQIAALTPDLILATNYYRLKDYHSTLSKIAPVLAYKDGPNTDTWQEVTTRIGIALGREDTATAAIRDVTQQINTATRVHSALSSTSFTFSSFGEAGQLFTKCSTNDVLVKTLSSFGLRLSPQTAALSESSTAGIASVSPEEISLIDADLMFVVFTSDQQRADAQLQPLYQKLGAVQGGRCVNLTGAESQAMAFPSVLSVKYFISNTLPRVVASLSS